MTETTTTAVPDPEPAGSQEPERSSGAASENLGNWLIGGALLLAFLLAVGLRYNATSGDPEERVRVDAEFAFTDERRPDAEVEFARQTIDDVDLRLVEECEEFRDDGDAESRFADDDTNCVTAETSVGLFGEVDDLINFDRLERPLLRHDLSDRGSSRILELSIWVEDDRDEIDLAIDADDQVLFTGNGAAVRTGSSARSLSNTRFVSITPDSRCDEGCSVTVWITLGRNFQELYPDAELVVYVDGDAEASVEDLDQLPRQAYR